jgi:drug/metabolite transporter (DMT)-like permease
MLAPPDNRTENIAKVACTVAGAIWGLFWIPVRALHEAGIQGLWATAVFYLVPFVLMLPIGLLRWRQIISAGWMMQGIAIIGGLCLVLYSTAFLYTDVIHATLLYYLTPIWSALLARAWLKEPITRDRTLAIILGTAGLLVILNLDQGIPIPRNPGDWMALISGLIWALFANVMRRSESSYNTVDVLFSWFFWATIIAVALWLLPILDRPDPPTTDQIVTILPWLIPVALFVIIPGFYAITWGVPLLNPGTVGVLFMTEISVGAISAALLTDEPFGVREILGVILITVAGLTEVVVPILGTLFPSRRTRGDGNR